MMSKEKFLIKSNFKFIFDEKKSHDNNRVVFPEDHNVNPDIIELIRACLIKDPDQRITLDELMVSFFYQTLILTLINSIIIG